MDSDVSFLTILVPTLFTLTLPIGIDCCGYTTTQIISLMSQDLDYKRNPCYIQWQEEQDAKPQDIWKRRQELEKSIRQNEENQRRAYENQRNTESNTYTSTSAVKKPSNVLVLGIILGVFSGICFCGVCISICLKDDDSTALPTTTTPRNDFNNGGFTAVSMPPTATIDAPINQTVSHSLPTNNPSISGIDTENRAPISREVNVPLLPRGPITRQNSLPSYDDAMRTPSAPPKE